MPPSAPFFKCFGPLLFGCPPASALKTAFEKLSKCDSLAQLRSRFGCYFPAALLAPNKRGTNSRERIFSQEVIFWSFLEQVQNPGAPCREAVRKVIAYVRRKLPKSEPLKISANTAAYCSARARLPLEVIGQINAHLVEHMQKNIPKGALWHGRKVKLVDGSSLSMPDTPENQERWPQSSGQKPGCGFPLMNLVGIFCLLSGALLHVATGNLHTHESVLFQSLWHTLVKGDVLVADRGYCSFGTFASLLAKGVDVFMRVPLKKISQALAAKLPNTDSFDVIVSWERPLKCPSTLSAEAFALLPESMQIRVVRYTVAQAGFRTRSVTVATTLLEAQIKPAELAELYFRRWRVEVHFREMKTVLRMDVLRCKSPHMIERELQMHVVAYNLIRSVMQKAANTHEVDLGRISFKGALDTVRHFAHAAQAAEDKPRIVAALLDEMLWIIARDLTPHRPARSEPRAIKRRPKTFHYLTKPRHEMGNLPHRNTATAKTPKSALN